jgi:hypothetical protein
MESQGRDGSADCWMRWKDAGREVNCFSYPRGPAGPCRDTVKERQGKRTESSAADTLHLALDGRETIGAKPVRCRFLKYGGTEYFSQLIIRSAIS